MNISIVSLFPELYQPFLATSLVRRAQEKNLISVNVASLFSYVEPKERVDAPTFGHGAGMLLRPDVVQKAIEDQEQAHGKSYKIFFSPRGQKLSQKKLQQIKEKSESFGHIMMLPARYEGMDARVEQVYADEIISVGDFVLMGGDVPAMILLEGLLRLLPGVIGKQESVTHDSFNGPFVDYPEYTEPVVWHGLEVPDV
jgi:tRNA (guanine37-N1)-methyltransferase